MRIIIFDLKGSIAHFRKFYTNSSSLTYDFPPRTTVTGIIAGILGMERDSYYDDFACDRCHVAIRILNGSRRLMQTVNYIFVKENINQVTGSKGKHTQIPVEFLLPSGDRRELAFRIYFNHVREDIMDSLEDRLRNERYSFPPYLGITECIGYAEYVGTDEGERVYTEQVQKILSVCPKDNIKVIKFDEKIPTRYLKDKIPVEFDRKRRIKKTMDVVYEPTGKPMHIIPQRGIVKTFDGNITFLE